jgi:hypothetical protein
MTQCLIISAMGLGDWIIINPIVRICSERFDRVGLVYNDYSETFLKYMFPDLPNVCLDYNCKCWIPDVNLIIQKRCSEDIVPINLMIPGNLIPGGYKIDTVALNKPFNYYIYEKSGFDWMRDCPRYHIPIDNSETHDFFQSLRLPERYIFLHEGDHPGWGGHPRINRKYFLNKNLPVFVPHVIDNPFLYKDTIERADEIHVVDSSFRNFADKLSMKTDKIFFHKTRTRFFQTPFCDPKLNKPWIEIFY